jgi:predicted ATPase
MLARHREATGNPPAASDGFVGRDRELDSVCTLLLDSARLITLIGSGGIGKTRLAAEAVRRYHKATATPVYWVRLARLARDASAAAVEEEVAQSILDADFSGRPMWDSIVGKCTRTDAVGRQLQTVLVIDNCEHVLAAAGTLITDLLEAIPGLTIVATSREAVGWVDERFIAVPPLTREQALTLFRQRAEQLRATRGCARRNLRQGHVHPGPAR